MQRRGYSSPLPGILALVLAAGCAQDVVAPTKASGRPQFTQIANRHGNPNAVKYKNAGAQPATGRSGNAAMELRALLARDGSAQIEATTGSLEASTRPGNIDKAQLKTLAGKTSTTNFNNLKAGGYWTTTLASLARGDQVQVQANVSGIDPRVDVVTATTAGVRRPDLAVQNINGPATAMPHNAVTFTATVSELNGDVGARSDCVLSVNGSAAEHADGIWVDASGTVSCVFTHTFDSPGTYGVSVAATNVNPGDWDDSNNSASASITIAQPGGNIPSGFIEAVSTQQHQVQTGYNVSGSTYNYVVTQDLSYSLAYANGWDSGTDNPGGFQRVDASVSVNGVPFMSTSLSPTSSSTYDDGTYWSRCDGYDNVVFTSDASGYTQASDGKFATVCSNGTHGVPGSTSSSYSFEVVAGAVTYYSHGVDCPINQGCNTWTSNQQYLYGTIANPAWPLGSAIRVQATFVDGGALDHTIDETIYLNEDQSYYVNNSSRYCWYDYSHAGQLCQDNVSTGYQYVGINSWYH